MPLKRVSGIATKRGPVANSPKRHAVAILALLVVGLSLRLWGIHVTSQTSVIGMPLTDDSYYYFSLGRNLAMGNGPRVDAFHTTTGFQPLWSALVALAFTVADSSSTAIAITQFLGALAGIVTGGLLYAFVRDLSGSRSVALLMASWWLLSP